MITKPRRALLAAVAVATVCGGGVAAAEPATDAADVTAYACDALTSASVPTVRKQLTAQGVDVSKVTGPVGLSCRRTATGQDGVEASVTGVSVVAYQCGSSAEKNGTKIVFFEECAHPTPTTDGS